MRLERFICDRFRSLYVSWHNRPSWHHPHTIFPFHCLTSQEEDLNFMLQTLCLTMLPSLSLRSHHETRTWARSQWSEWKRQKWKIKIRIQGHKIFLTRRAWYPYVLFSGKKREEKLKKATKKNLGTKLRRFFCLFFFCVKNTRQQRKPSSGCFIMIIYFFSSLLCFMMLWAFVVGIALKRSARARFSSGRKQRERRKQVLVRFLLDKPLVPGLDGFATSSRRSILEKNSLRK